MAAILIISFAIGLIVGLPVAITMGISGLTAVLIDGRFPPLIVPQYLFNGISSFPLMAVPFFILAAEIMTASGLTASLLRFANDLVGHIRGGLGHVNVLVSMLFAGISGSALADAAGPKVIKYAHFQPAKLDQPKQAAALAFKNYVESNTKGSVKVEIYPASQLGNAITVLEGLRLGSIEMGVVHDGPISPVFKPFMVYAIPYLFDDQAMAWSVVDGPFGQELGEAMRKATGIRMFALGDNGIRHFTNNKRVITSPEDMKGLKIRVMPGPIWSKLVSSLDASPSPVPWPELPAALQQGVVDGQENGVTNILAASLYQNQKYISLDGHVYSWHAYLMNDNFYNSLTPDEQKVVQRGVEIAKIIHRGMTSAQDTNAPTILSGVGMEVTPLSPEQVAAFRKKAQPAVVAWVKEQIGEEWVKKLFNAIETYRKANY